MILPAWARSGKVSLGAFFSAFAVRAALSGCLVSAGTVFTGCLFTGEKVAGKGGGTETESKVAGLAVNPDGSAAVGARVTLRPSDYLADPVSTEEESRRMQETNTDAQGRYRLRELPAGAYRVEIAGTESGGSIRDFSLSKDSMGLDLGVDTLKPRGSIIGSFAPDSEAQLARFIQVFGLERLVMAEPSGGFILYNLPEGTYDIRCSSLQPFRRDAVRRNITVRSGEQTVIEPVRLEKDAKLAFSVDSAGLLIVGLDSTNPVIFDNERWANGIDNEYIWAKASIGSLDLRGNIVTTDMNYGKNTIPEELARGQAELNDARLAGFTGIPDLVVGAEARLTMPASGRIEDMVAIPTPGSDLIVAEARKATPEKPLLVLVGGPLTTVAQAYLTDPSIASRMVVAGIFSFTLQSADSAANHLVAKKCRFLQWGRNYTWGGTPDTALYEAVPMTRLGERVRNFLRSSPTRLSFGDLAPVAFLFRRGAWKTADMVKVSAAMEVQPASDITFDFLDIPVAANEWRVYTDEFRSALADPRAYHAAALPGRIEAEGMIGKSPGVGYHWADSAAGNLGAGYGAGDWSEYKVEAAQAGSHQIVLRYRTGGGAQISLGVPGKPPIAEAALPVSAEWAEITVPAAAFEPGAYRLRLTGVTGSFNLDWIRIVP